MKNPVVVNMLDGAVQRQGVRLSLREWLDPGSSEYAGTSHEARAAGYQAAVAGGFKDDGLVQIMLTEFAPRMTLASAEAHISTLKALAEKYPIQVEDNTEPVETKWKVGGTVVDKLG